MKMDNEKRGNSIFNADCEPAKQSRLKEGD